MQLQNLIVYLQYNNQQSTNNNIKNKFMKTITNIQTIGGYEAGYAYEGNFRGERVLL